MYKVILAYKDMIGTNMVMLQKYGRGEFIHKPVEFCKPLGRCY
jgi:hypothetical protein